MLRISQLPTAQAVAVNSAAVFDMPLNQRVHVIWLKFSDDGTASTGGGNTGVTALERMVSEIQLKFGETVIRSSTARQLAVLNARHGAQYAIKEITATALGGAAAGNAGYTLMVPIFLAEPWREGHDPRTGIPNAEVPAWNIVGVPSFKLVVKFKDTTVAAPKLSGFYEWDEPRGALGTITKWESHSFEVAGLETDIGPLERSGSIQAIHLFKDGAGEIVTRVRVLANGQVIRDDVALAENEVKLLVRGMTPDSLNRYSIEFDYDDKFRNALPAGTLTRLRLRATRSAGDATSMPAIIERAEPAL